MVRARTAGRRWVDQHRRYLSGMAAAVDGFLRDTPWDEPARPGVGLALLLFAGELASALRPQQYRAGWPAELVGGCEQTVSTATLAAAGCLVGLMEAVRVLSGLAEPR